MPTNLAIVVIQRANKGWHGTLAHQTGEAERYNCVRANIHITAGTSKSLYRIFVMPSQTGETVHGSNASLDISTFQSPDEPRDGLPHDARRCVFDIT